MRFPAWPPGSRCSHTRRGGAAHRICPRAFIPLPAPAPTVELELTDALALSVSGRGAAEAAPQRLTLAARRPPAAGEGHCQQPQPPHPRLALGAHASASKRQRLPVPRRQLGKGEEGAGPVSRTRPHETNSQLGGPLCHEPRIFTNQSVKWAGRAQRESHHSPACWLVPAFFFFFFGWGIRRMLLQRREKVLP